MNALWKRACALVALVPLLACGCTDPYAGRNAVSGTVKFKGDPLADGVIIFEPLDKQDTQAGATIAKGSYTIARQKGLKTGKYRVRVTAGDGVTKAQIEGGPELKPEEAAGPGGSRNIISKELIPPTWNVASKQETTITQGANQKDFDIPGK